MDNTNFSREELLNRIKDLEMLNAELLKEKQQEERLNYDWTGNLGHWYWNVLNNEVTFNPLKATTLGYEMSELPAPVTYQFFTDKIHPDDFETTMTIMKDHLYGKTDVYEVEYRIQSKDGNYKWFHDRGKITQFDDKGAPAFLAGIVFDVTDKKRHEKELEEANKLLFEMSVTDGLTRIFNHRSLIGYLKKEMNTARKSKSPLSLAIFDIDDFKKINDSLGHVYGDQVLLEVANIIKRNVRDSDIVGRYGGEEFMVIFTGTSLENAAIVAERIRKAIAEFPFPQAVSVTISGGIKQFENQNIRDLINQADKNLYKSKHNGKNQIIS